MNNKLYIIGAGSVGGHIALNITDYSNKYEIKGFFDDDPEKIGTIQYGYRVLGTVRDSLELEDIDMVIGIAFPRVKKDILEKLSQNNTIKFPSLVHNKSWISKGVTLGKGCIIYPGTTINYGSNIGDFVVVNANCSLGHHTQIGKYSSLAPGVNSGGHTRIDEGVDMGIGASTIQNKLIGAYSIVGGQCMIIREVMPNTTVAGVPAKVISLHGREEKKTTKRIPSKVTH